MFEKEKEIEEDSNVVYCRYVDPTMLYGDQNRVDVLRSSDANWCRLLRVAVLPIVNFIFHQHFMHSSSCQYLFTLLGSTGAKAARTLKR